MMPKMSGYELTRELRKRNDFRLIPILLLTAKSQLEDTLEGFEAGANDYVVKPFSRLELKARLETQLTVRAQSKRLEELTTNLQSELYTRNDMVTDLAHRGNNPLQSGSLAVSNANRELASMLSIILALVNDDNDPEVLAVQRILRKAQTDLETALSTIDLSFTRLERVISEIRLLSGVDGFDIIPTNLRDCIRMAKERVTERVGTQEANRLSCKIPPSGSLILSGHPTVLAIALERLFYQLLKDSPQRIEILLTQNVMQEIPSFRFEWQREERCEFSSNFKTLLSNLNHMTKAFGVSLHLSSASNAFVIEYWEEFAENLAI
jgi:CheY-like chemotaxis protein